MITTLIILFIASTAVQLYFHFSLFKKHNTDNDKVIVSVKHIPEITILICAKNESENLQKNLPKILEQDYPLNKFTVLVINDNSDDNTVEVLQNLQNNYPHLKTITIPQNENRIFGGKKHALHIGMQHIDTQLVLLTDADCSPASSKWLQLMCSKSLANNNAVILGYGAYENQKGWLNKFIRYETVHTFKQYACMAAANRAYMGVGRNLLYPTAYYFEAIKDSEFLKQYKATISGDDDILINYLSKKNKNIIAYGNALAHTISTPPKDINSWLRQKKRHLSTGKLYTKPTKFTLGIYALSQAVFWLGGIALLAILLFNNGYNNPHQCTQSALCCSKLHLITVVVLMLIRNFFYYKSFARYANLLKEQSLKKWFPLLDLFWAIYNVLLSPFIFLKSKQQWK